jgi:hypothetical protein
VVLADLLGYGAQPAVERRLLAAPGGRTEQADEQFASAIPPVAGEGVVDQAVRRVPATGALQFVKVDRGKAGAICENISTKRSTSASRALPRSRSVRHRPKTLWRGQSIGDVQPALATFNAANRRSCRCAVAPLFYSA